MYRKTPFAENEHYHIYSRGVEKRKIFLNTKDYNRFVALLYIMNQTDPFRMDNFMRENKNNLTNIFNEERNKPLVSILGYCLMPNHFHLILYERTENGISKFMGKLLTAYSMYFNTKYERSGPLLTRPFRSEHISSESQYMYIFSYIHLNPLSIIDKTWKEDGVKNKNMAKDFLENYQFSSFQDFLEKDRPEKIILDFSLIPEYIKNMELGFKTYEQLFQENINAKQQS
ncbi:MAG: transposase [Candidatus Nomurabacteria bacterium]|nr:transposase [Candidatus Nomurabacteria bacterium]